MEGKRQGWQKGKGCFSLKTTNKADVLSLSVLYFLCGKLQASHFFVLFCFVLLLLILLWVHDCPRITLFCFALFGKRAMFHTKKRLFQEFPSWLSGKEFD